MLENAETQPKSFSKMITRRNFLKTIAGIGLVGTLGNFAFSDTSEDIELTNTNVPLKNLPSAFDSFRIGFLSDIHLSHALPIEWLEKAVRYLDESKIDLLILGGDYVWLPEPGKEPLIYKERNSKLAIPYGEPAMTLAFDLVADCVSKIKPKHGAYAIWGNHDHWTNTKICQRAFSKSHIKLISNGLEKIVRGNQKIILTFFDDYWTGIPRIPKYEPGKDCVIAAAHNPDFFSYLLSSGKFKFNLGISGHTHGGQIKTPLINSPLIHNIQDQRLSEGLFYDSSSDSFVYTSRGLGMVELPYRINCRPEVSVLELKKI